MSDLKCFTRIGKVFCVLTAYFDESYDDKKTMCVGGWLATDAVWGRIAPRWAARIRHESDACVRAGLKPLTRYHATYCASMVDEFQGWDQRRQIQFTKKLLDIMGTGNNRKVGAKPIGVACGVAYRELVAAFPQLKDPKDIKWHALKFGMIKCLQLLTGVMQRKFPEERATVIYDRTKEFGGAVQSAYDGICPPGSWPKQYIIGAMPGDWQDFTPLQAADLIAFEGFKLTGAYKRGGEGFRKSLLGIVRRGIPIATGYYTSRTFDEFKAWGLGLTGRELTP
jgi:hypothetical protein